MYFLRLSPQHSLWFWCLIDIIYCMKKYKNIFLSFSAYVIAIFWYLLGIYLGEILSLQPQSVTLGNILNGLVLYPSLILCFVGMFFGLRSNKSNESSWLGYLMIMIGFFVIISPLILTFISYRL